MGARLWVADTVTGDKIEDITNLVIGKSSDKWTRKVNGYGTATVDLQLNDSPHNYAVHQAWFEPWAKQIVWCWNDRGSVEDHVTQAGLITNVGWNSATGTLSLDTAEHEILLSRRFPYTIGRFPDGTVELFSTTARSALFHLVRRLFMEQPTPRSRLPIIDTYFVDDEAGPNDYLYPNHQFRSGQHIFSEISDNNGPDYDFRTHNWEGAGRFMLEPRIGNPYLHVLPPFEFNFAAQDANVFEVERHIDGLDQLTGIFATGEGQNENVKRQEAGEFGWESYQGPYLDALVTAPQEMDGDAELKKFAEASRDANMGPTKRFGFKMRADDVPGINELVPGMLISMVIPEDKMFPAETVNNRVIEYTGQDEMISFTFADA